MMMDQNKISNGFECLMISDRLGERAIAVGWRVVKTKGEIGFNDQKNLLESVAKKIPEGIKILLSADRFYGTSSAYLYIKIDIISRNLKCILYFFS